MEGLHHRNWKDVKSVFKNFNMKRRLTFKKTVEGYLEIELVGYILVH